MFAPCAACGGFQMASLACFACSTVTSVCNLCCSIAACFSCKATTKAAKHVYIILFFLSSVLGLFMRYYGEAALGSWVRQIGLCTDTQCFGVQAIYRISLALVVFFAALILLTAVFPVVHLGAWLIKTLLYILLLGLSLLLPNGSC